MVQSTNSGKEIELLHNFDGQQLSRDAPNVLSDGTLVIGFLAEEGGVVEGPGAYEFEADWSRIGGVQREENSGCANFDDLDSEGVVDFDSDDIIQRELNRILLQLVQRTDEPVVGWEVDVSGGSTQKFLSTGLGLFRDKLQGQGALGNGGLGGNEWVAAAVREIVAIEVGGQ